MKSEPSDGLRLARVRSAYGFGALITLQVAYGVVTRTPIDVSVLGILLGGLLAVLGIEVAVNAAKIIRNPKDDNHDG